MKSNFLFCLTFLFFLTACAGVIPEVREVVVGSSLAEEPIWLNQTIKQEGKCIFATGHSQPRPTVQEAKDDALARATEEIVRYSGVTVDAFTRSIEVSSQIQGKEYYKADFEMKSRIRAKAFVRRATPVEWYVRKMARMRGNKRISEYHLASVLLRVPEEEIERIQEEKDIKLSLDIGIYYEDEQGKLQYLTEGSVLHSGDAYALYVRPSDDCYLYIIQVDDLGCSYRLFPNEEYHTQVNPLKAGEDHWIPNTEEYFVLDETTGKERFYLFASLDQIVELEEASTLQHADFDRVLKIMGVAGLKQKINPYQAKPPKRIHTAEVKKKLQAEGAFVYETWFWHR